jgi:CheY-like chemotaxis protein
LKQVVWNLLSNAIKFTPKDGLVQICLVSSGPLVTIRVIDTGPGIEPEFLPYVFERFRQADGTTTRQHKGLGLGLAIVRDLVELHGGTVCAESEGAGRGSSFAVTLPRVTIPEKPPASIGAEPRKSFAEITELLGRQKPLEDVRVLVVDDEADARQIVTAMLEHSGAITTAVGSVREALDTLEAHKPDVLVADIGMPVEDGYVLIRKIRSRADNAGGGTPALALTAYARTEDRVRILAAGYQMHVAKPVEPMELVAAVANLAGRLRYRGEDAQ